MSKLDLVVKKLYRKPKIKKFGGLDHPVRSNQEGFFMLWLKKNRVDYYYLKNEYIKNKKHEGVYIPPCKIPDSKILIEYRSQVSKKEIEKLIHFKKIFSEHKLGLVVTKERQRVKIPKECYDKLLILEENYYHLDYENPILQDFLAWIENSKLEQESQIPL